MIRSILLTPGRRALHETAQESSAPMAVASLAVCAAACRPAPIAAPARRAGGPSLQTAGAARRPRAIGSRLGADISSPAATAPIPVRADIRSPAATAPIPVRADIRSPAATAAIPVCAIASVLVCAGTSRPAALVTLFSWRRARGAAASASLPPCGGGSGWGVRPKPMRSAQGHEPSRPAPVAFQIELTGGAAHARCVMPLRTAPAAGARDIPPQSAAAARRRRLRRSVHVLAAVDRDLGAGHIGGLGTAQIVDHRGDLGW
jgi:hypothetical protein